MYRNAIFESCTFRFNRAISHLKGNQDKGNYTHCESHPDDYSCSLYFGGYGGGIRETQTKRECINGKVHTNEGWKSVFTVKYSHFDSNWATAGGGSIYFDKCQPESFETCTAFSNLATFGSFITSVHLLFVLYLQFQTSRDLVLVLIK